MKNKKAAIAITTIVTAIIMLTVVGVVGYGSYQLLFGEETNLVRVMLGFGNISAFDKDIVERYNLTKGLHEEAVHSINALLYATNALAVFNTYTDKRKKPEEYEKLSGFGQTKVKYTLEDSRIIYPSGTEEQISTIIAKNIVECWRIFRDNGFDNSRCFLIDTSRFGNVEITSEDLGQGFENYYKDPECNKKCKDHISEIDGTISNWDWDSGLVLKKGLTERVRICGDDDWINEIHITTDEDTCVTPPNALTFGFAIEDFNLPQEISYSESAFVYSVEKWLNAFGDPEYILYYEKFPEGEDEFWQASSYNVAVGTILTVEGIFLIIDAGTFLLGRYALAPLKAVLAPPLSRLIQATIRPVIDVARKGITAVTPGFLRSSYRGIKKGITGVLGVLTKAKQILSDLAAWPFRRIMFRQLTLEMAEEGVERAARETVENILERRLGKKTFEELSEETIETITQRYIGAFRSTKEVFEETGEEMIERGALTRNARQALDFEFDRLFKEIGPDELTDLTISRAQVELFGGNTIIGDPKQRQAAINMLLDEHNTFARELKNEISEEGVDRILFSMKDDIAEEVGEASLRTPTRAMVKRYKAAARAVDNLRAAATGDFTREERQEIIEKIVRDGAQVLDNMNPRDASKFIAHTDTKETIDYIFRDGDFIWDLGGKKFTAAQKVVATEAFDEAVEDLAVSQQFKQSILIQRAYGKTVAFLNPIQKKRHLVAAAAALGALKIADMNEKFVSVGTNAIGLKIPYGGKAFKEFETGVDYNLINKHLESKKPKSRIKLTPDEESRFKKHEGRVEEILQNFGQPGYQGTLPELNRYWMSLTRDKLWYWFEQDPIRFHLVSPCKADILIKVSNCECIGKPIKDTIGTSESWIGALFENQGVYETGKSDNQLFEQFPDVYPNGVLPHFDGQDPSLFTLDENGNPIKQCNPSGEWSTLGERPYKVKCIKFNPILDESVDPNYCYHGLSPLMSIANGLLNYALPIGSALACLGGGPVGSAMCGAIGGATGSLTYAFLSTGHQWPNHS